MFLCIFCIAWLLCITWSIHLHVCIARTLFLSWSYLCLKNLVLPGEWFLLSNIIYLLFFLNFKHFSTVSPLQYKNHFDWHLAYLLISPPLILWLNKLDFYSMSLTIDYIICHLLPMWRKGFGMLNTCCIHGKKGRKELYKSLIRN